MEENINWIGLTDNETKVFMQLRKIAMKNGSVRLNYDKNGDVKSVDEYRHFGIDLDLSTGLSTPT